MSTAFAASAATEGVPFSFPQDWRGNAANDLRDLRPDAWSFSGGRCGLCERIKVGESTLPDCRMCFLASMAHIFGGILPAAKMLQRHVATAPLECWEPCSCIG